MALPCALGAAFGGPLVASELEHHTNRLMWTQGISRVRWFLSKWAGLAVIVVTLVALLTLETQWWTSHVFEVSSLNVSPGNFGRLSPYFFPISGVAAVAYTLFALSLGTAAGDLTGIQLNLGFWPSVLLYFGLICVPLPTGFGQIYGGAELWRGSTVLISSARNIMCTPRDPT